MAEPDEKSPVSTTPEPPAAKGRRWEWAGVVALLGAVAAMLQVSWRRWPDAIVDFGRELYLPWRLSEGAVLYRDVAAISGPLSQYFNSLVFRLTGPGLMHLVAVNLLIYAVILALIYHIVRTGWGRLAAFAGALVFVVAFSFSQYALTGNYNFATPYAHETTHGFLLILILILIALGTRWREQLTAPRALALGIVTGLSLLLKVEIALGAGAVVFGLAVRSGMAGIWPRWKAAGAFLGGMVAPPLLATAGLHQAGGFSWAEAARRANGGWLGPLVYQGIARDPFQTATLGFFHPVENLTLILVTGGLSLGLAWGLAWLSSRVPGKILLVPAVAVAVLISSRLVWLHMGLVLPVWLGFAGWLTIREGRRDFSAAAAARWLLICAAGALLVRMALLPRIYHYGYCQAALAAVVVTATVFCALPALFKLTGWSRIVYLAAAAVFLGVGLGRLYAVSRSNLVLKRVPIGEGADLFYGNAMGEIFEETRRFLAAAPDGQTLVVMPEGVMLNYLLRKPVPIAPYVFNPDWLRQWQPQIDQLPEHPPDYVVLISRDLQEYGVGKFGESPEHGEKVLSWVADNYEVVETFGAPPLMAGGRGAVIMRRSR